MNLRTGVALSILMALCLVGGCAEAGREADEEVLTGIKADMESHVRSLEEKGTAGQREAANGIREVLKLLNEHGASYVTEVPDPYVVSAGKSRYSSRVKLVVYWLERSSDIAAIRVREYWSSGQVISEVYELNSQTRSVLSGSDDYSWWKNAMSSPVVERHTPEMRQDQKAWNEWARAEVEPDSQPDFYLAKPSQEVHVLISLIDGKGHESRAMPLIWVEE